MLTTYSRSATWSIFVDGEAWRHCETTEETKDVALYAKCEEAEQLRRAICQLQPPLGNVVEIHQVSDRAVSETAELAGLSVSATKSRLLRARTLLRRALS